MQVHVFTAGIIFWLCGGNDWRQQWWVSGSLVFLLFFFVRSSLDNYSVKSRLDSTNFPLQASMSLSLNESVSFDSFDYGPQDDWPVGGSAHVHGPRLRRSPGRGGPGLRLPTAWPPEPGAALTPPDGVRGVREIWKQHRSVGRSEPGWF